MQCVHHNVGQQVHEGGRDLVHGVEDERVAPGEDCDANGSRGDGEEGKVERPRAGRDVDVQEQEALHEVAKVEEEEVEAMLDVAIEAHGE